MTETEPAPSAAAASPASAPTGARYAGRRVRRLEDARLLTGRGMFVDDVRRPGMLHACFVRSPFARARINSIDVCAALASPGVRAVFTAADLNPDVRESWYTQDGPKVPDSPRPPLADGEARFAGDPVAMVVATDRYLAEDAAELVEVDYEPLDAVVDFREALASPVQVHASRPGNIAGRLTGTPPDAVEAACAGAAHVAEETFRQQMHTPSPMETRGIVAEWDGRELTIWSSTQNPHEVRAFTARLLGIPPERVRVIMRDTGGAFGLKVVPGREEQCVLLAARKVAGPLKWIEDRRENLLCHQARHESGRARIAFAADGTILAASIDHLQDMGAYPTPWQVGPGAAVGMLFPGPYRVPVATWTSTSVHSNTAGRVPYRGPWQFESLAREVLLDIAARDLGIDPVELRRRNLLSRDDLPWTNPNGMPYDHASPRETFEAALAALGYDAFRAEQRAARAHGRYLGVGTSSYLEPTTSGQPYYGSEEATVRVDPSGRVTVFFTGGSSGNSLETTVAQLAADALGIEFDLVEPVQGDTAVTPAGAGTGGSRSGSMTAGAVGEAARALLARLTALAAHRFGVGEDEIEVADGRAVVRGRPGVGATFGELAAYAAAAPPGLPEHLAGVLEASGRHTTPAPMLWANATHVCVVEVDVATGAVTILRHIVGEDVGPMINPDVVEGQIAGGTVQGIGGALLERQAYDADGNPLVTTLLDYLIPTAAEVPLIEYVHLETPAPGPGGYKGVGEGGAIGAPPAVVNAVVDALSPFGVKITELPVTPAAIVELLAAAGYQGGHH
ncbi:MAG: xanthine dehydrogenase family protein molybdopterin-binding subunit [Frankia sp.]|nr:xanthine dehydrogenase family protein molybdopterin-binding subunit [Frankia sp.]